MSFSHSRSGGDLAIVTGIIAGQPWVASHFRNPCFFKHGRAFARMFRHPRAVTAALRDPCRRLVESLAHRSHLLDRTHPLSPALVPMITRVAAYADAWKRAPESWRPSSTGCPESSWSDLIRHLFADWPLPAFLDSAWTARGGLRSLERDWFCHLAGGGSWRRAPGFPRSVSTRAAHFALQAPAAMSVSQALWWGQLAALGASEPLITEVVGHKFVSDFTHDDIWSRLLAKVAASADFKPREFGVIADRLVELLDHGHEKRARLLVGLPLAELRRHAFRRWRELLEMATAEGIRFRDKDLTRPGVRAELRHLTEAQWDPMSDVRPCEMVLPEGMAAPSLWVFRERISHAQLIIEGRELRHCVADYWRRCRRGDSAIFSLRQLHPAIGPDRQVARLTIEVHRGSRRIVQARGRWNRPPDSFERRLLTRWAVEQRLTIAV